MTLSNEFITKKMIHEGSLTRFYLGNRKSDQSAILIKLLKNEYPTASEVTRLRHDYNLSRSSPTISALTVIDLVDQHGQLALLTEMVEGEFLSEILKKGPLSIDEFLKIAIAIVKALNEIHSAHIIHKNINPEDILWAKEAIKFTDFSIATTLAKETPTDISRNLLEGTLAYMSPEQTGRMNISVDYRSDYYSLGVLLYQMLTGKLPFYGEDALSLTHAHLAVLPKPVKELNPEVPEILSNIISKLLEKNPDKRYQTALGLLHDLSICLKSWQTEKKMIPFELASEDLSPTLKISNILYGREKEIETLFSDFEDALKGKKTWTLVAGAPGIGKTSLVNELYKPLTKKKAFFVRSKFDQLKQNIPYSAFTQALGQWVRQILLLPEEEINQWKISIHDALAPNGQIMVNLIPTLESLIGKQKEAPEVDPTQEEGRLFYTFEQMINTIGTPKHPLTFFLDDLQWIEPGSLKLLNHLFTSENIRSVYVVGAYRDTEVDETHPLMHLIKKLSESQVTVHQLSLGPLSQTATTAWLSDSLNLQPEEVKDLSQLCYDKTAGNPFFLGQFLQSLYEDRLLHLDFQQHRWTWDLQKAKQQKITDNVVTLMTEKIQKIPAEPLELLTIAACIGVRFNLAMLSYISEKDPKKVTELIWQLFETGLILPENEKYIYMGELALENITCYFLHDRVQEAAYSILSPERQAKTHLRIGRHLLAEVKKEERDTYLFDIVGHLNRGRLYITDESEKLMLAELNNAAASKAMASTAYDMAEQLIAVGLELLGKDAWEKQYGLTLSFYQMLVAKHLNAKEVEQVHEIAQQAIPHCKTSLDSVEFYVTDMAAYSLVADFRKAVTLGLEILKKLGLNLSKWPKSFYAYITQLKINWLLRKKKIADLINSPKITDPRILAIMRIMTTFHLPSSFSKKEYFYLKREVTIRTYFSIRYGLSEEAISNFADYALMLFYFEKKIPDVGELIELNERLIKANPNSRYNIEGAIITNCMAGFASKSVHELVPRALEIFQLSKAKSDLLYGMTALLAYLLARPAECSRNLSLQEIYKEYLLYQPIVMSSKNPYAILIYTGGFNYVSVMIGERSMPSPLIDEALLEAASFVKFGQAHYLVYSAQLAYMFENYDKAHETMKRGKDNIYLPKFFNGVVSMYVIDSLIELARYKKVGAWEKMKILFHVWDNQRRIKKRMEIFKDNFEHWHCLVQAELYRVLGLTGQAQKYYEIATKLAKKNDFIWANALSLELTAKFYIEHDNLSLAQIYMNQSVKIYRTWGAKGKVLQLEQNYSNLIGDETKAEGAGSAMTLTQSEGSALDLHTVLKANQILSQEIHLKNLLKSMLRLSIENAGAERALFIDYQGESPTVLAETTMMHDKENFSFVSVPLEKYEKLPKELLNFVIRTKDVVVISNAVQDEMTAQSEYAKRDQVKSLLCMPIIHHEVLIGIIYLENNLTVGAFTKERVVVLSSLTSQIAISLENSRYLERMERLYRSTERFVPKPFLKLLKKEHVEDVKLGDSIEAKLTILFTDIRGYTTITENQSPQEAFAFINDYLRVMAPIIRAHQGFINQYQGDGIMALFPGKAEDAVSAVQAMSKALIKYNADHPNHPNLEVGYGLNTGMAMLGTIGELERMDANVISDAINLASRVESLNKFYGTAFLISDSTFSALENLNLYVTRIVDKVRVKGKKNIIQLYEVYFQSSVDDKERNYIDKFESSFRLYENGNFSKALEGFNECINLKAQDKSSELFIERCQKLLESPPIEGWDGTYDMTHK